jgi:hypothetical protein
MFSTTIVFGLAFRASANCRGLTCRTKPTCFVHHSDVKKSISGGGVQNSHRPLTKNPDLPDTDSDNKKMPAHTHAMRSRKSGIKSAAGKSHKDIEVPGTNDLHLKRKLFHIWGTTYVAVYWYLGSYRAAVGFAALFFSMFIFLEIGRKVLLVFFLLCNLFVDF